MGGIELKNASNPLKKEFINVVNLSHSEIIAIIIPIMAIDFSFTIYFTS